MPTLTLAHSPDPDDAFMWWPLGDTGAHTGTPREPSIDTGPYRFTSIPADIHELNVRAVRTADLDITAISMFTYAHVAHRYALASCGSSIGDGYGPKVVARPDTIEEATSSAASDARTGQARLHDWLLDPTAVIAVPGERTSAFLALRLLLGRPFHYEVLRFDQIADAVAEGRYTAGIVIHESQLTYQDLGLALVVDLGAWWSSETSTEYSGGLPLPLGANAVRLDLDDRFGLGTSGRVVDAMKRSIEYALANRSQGLAIARASALADHAHATADPERMDRFVSMYVNDLTVDLGPAGSRGRRGVERFLQRAVEAQLVPSFGPVRIVGPE